MTTLDAPSGASIGHRIGWPRTVALHLGPGAAAFAVALLLAPVMHAWRLPAGFGLTVAFALVLTPLELGLLLRAANRATGRWSVREIRTVLAYPRRLGPIWLLVPVLFAFALVAAVVWSPAGAAIGDHLAGIYPDWTLPGYDDTAGLARPVLVATALGTLAIDGIVNPIVEELWFRGYLLPRMPVTGLAAAPWSAGLFAVQHYWQPYNWPLIFGLQVVIVALVLRLRCLRLGVVMHVLANTFGAVLTLSAVLAA